MAKKLLEQFRQDKSGAIVPVLIKRETETLEKYGKHRGKAIIIILSPDQQISFQIKGTRQTFSCHISDALALAKLRSQQDRDKHNADEYKKKRAQGQRARKPKRTNLFMAPVYHKALEYGAKMR